MQEWRRKNREHLKKYLRKLMKRKREGYRSECIKLLGGKCVKCGFFDVRALQIDHVNANASEDKKRFGTNYTYYKYVAEQIKAGSKDYQLLCANCNWIKRHEEGSRGGRKPTLNT